MEQKNVFLFSGCVSSSNILKSAECSDDKGSSKNPGTQNNIPI